MWLLIPVVACSSGLSPSPTPTWESTRGAAATGLGWADVDGDGVLDLVIANGNDVEPGTLSVHTGVPGALPDPTPSWQSEATHLHGQLAVGDVDGDGFDDVVATRYIGDGDDGDPGGLGLYLGSPSGLVHDWSWQGAFTFSVALGDADGDGDLDLAVATGQLRGAEPAPDLLFEYDGGFGTEPAWQSDDAAHSFDVGFAASDLVFSRAGSPHARYANDGALATSPTWLAPGSGFAGNRLALGDVDGDGAVDLVVADNVHFPGAGEVRLYCGADWRECWSEGGARGWSAVALADLDDDGDLDVATGEWYGPLRWFETENGSPGDEVWTSETELVAEALWWRDIDGDGILDLTVSNWELEHGSYVFGGGR